MAQVILSVNLDETDGTTSVAIEHIGLVDEAIAPLLLLGVEQHIVSETKKQVEADNPLAAPEVIDAMSILNGRLRLFDMVMHNPTATRVADSSAFFVPPDV